MERKMCLRFALLSLAVFGFVLVAAGGSSALTAADDSPGQTESEAPQTAGVVGAEGDGEVAPSPSQQPAEEAGQLSPVLSDSDAPAPASAALSMVFPCPQVAAAECVTNADCGCCPLSGDPGTRAICTNGVCVCPF